MGITYLTPSGEKAIRELNEATATWPLPFPATAVQQERVVASLAYVPGIHVF